MTAADEARRARRDIDDAERNLQNALSYVRHSNGRAAEDEIERALRSLDDATRKLKRIV